jgi:hypothetical protein
VFCGSSFGSRPEYAAAATALGTILAGQEIGLVYGGAKVGLMGTIADAVLQAGGEVIGVIPEGLVLKEIAHSGLTELKVVHSMHERKALMASLSDGFIALPGGFGTFEEFCEILTWAQLGLHHKPCGLLNIAGYYDHLIAMFNHAVGEKLLKPEFRDFVLADTEPELLLAKMRSYRPPVTEKWITPKET